MNIGLFTQERLHELDHFVVNAALLPQRLGPPR